MKALVALRVFASGWLVFCGASARAAGRAAEKLDRGFIARPAADGAVYLGWRLLPDDPPDLGFRVCRIEKPGAPAVACHEQPVTRTTDFTDRPPSGASPLRYELREVRGRRGSEAVAEAEVTRGDEARPYIRLAVPNRATVQKIGVGDLDGDGRLDYVLKTPRDNIDPYEKYWKPSPDTYKLEAVGHDGRHRWTHDLGWAIERGIWYSPFLVFDFDGDGRAEVAVKAGEGDPRDPDGRVRSGPEYFAILDGRTGAPRTRLAWPPRDPFLGGSDRGYNYSSRNQLGVAYLDGRRPHLIVARGTYTYMTALAYTLEKDALKEVWRWDNAGGPKNTQGQGAHMMHCADVDGDGRDEVILGSLVLDDNGRLLWTTGLGHPDHAYVGDLNPARPGLEIYYGIERAGPSNTMCLVDAGAGRILWGFDQPTKHVHAQGLCADIDPAHPGAECYSGERDDPAKRWLWSSAGSLLAVTNLGSLAPLSAWWDADATREILRDARLYAFDGRIVAREIEGDTVMVADLLGDWREEIVTGEPGEIRIFTTTVPARDRRPCLLTDPVYRIDVAHAAMGYYQPPLPSFDMATSTAR